MLTFVFVCVAALAVWLVVNSRSKPASTDRGAPLQPSRNGTSSSDGDSWEGSFWEVENPKAVKATLILDYRDSKGAVSKRTIDVRQIGPYDDTQLIIAFCRMRNATRTFRTDRILSCIDAETGEVVSNATTHLNRLYEASPERSMELLLDEQTDTLRVLLYVGKADGQLRAAEKAVIRETCAALTDDARVTDELIDQMLRDLQVPTLPAFRLAVGRIAKRGKEAQETALKAAERIVDTQKTVHANEKEALDYMRSRFATAQT